MHLVVIRHGESLKNIGNRFDGHNLDNVDQLTENGISHLFSISEFLRSNCVVQGKAIIITGNRKRCIDSAAMLSKFLSVQYQIVDEIVPVNPGKLSCLSEQDAWKIFPELMELRKRFSQNLVSGYEISFPGGDNLREYELRIKRAISNLENNLPRTEQIILVTHRSVIVAVLNIFYKLLGQQLENTYQYYPTAIGNIDDIYYNHESGNRVIRYGGIEQWLQQTLND